MEHVGEITKEELWERYPEVIAEIIKDYMEETGVEELLSKNKPKTNLLPYPLDGRNAYVLSLYHGDIDKPWIWNGTKYQAWEGTASAEYKTLIGAGFSICQVVRREDEQIFTVGDKIRGTNSMREPQQGFVTIRGFRLRDNDILIQQDTGFTVLGNKLNIIDDSKVELPEVKDKKPLFTTNDGVDIFDGDPYYSIMWGNIDGTSAKEVHRGKYSTQLPRFSTKELAQDYLNNKNIIF